VGTPITPGFDVLGVYGKIIISNNGFENSYVSILEIFALGFVQFCKIFEQPFLMSSICQFLFSKL